MLFVEIIFLIIFIYLTKFSSKISSLPEQPFVPPFNNGISKRVLSKSNLPFKLSIEHINISLFSWHETSTFDLPIFSLWNKNCLFKLDNSIKSLSAEVTFLNSNKANIFNNSQSSPLVSPN